MITTPIPAASIRPLKYLVFPADSTPTFTSFPAFCQAAARFRNAWYPSSVVGSWLNLSLPRLLTHTVNCVLCKSIPTLTIVFSLGTGKGPVR
jgi:hypothetical protein